MVVDRGCVGVWVWEAQLVPCDGGYWRIFGVEAPIALRRNQAKGWRERVGVRGGGAAMGAGTWCNEIVVACAAAAVMCLLKHTRLTVMPSVDGAGYCVHGGQLSPGARGGAHMGW